MAARKNMHPTPSEPPLYGDRRRVAIVTGAARGIGRAVALRLAHDGLDVAINDVNADGLEDLKAELNAAGAKSIIIVGDVSDDTIVEKMVNDTAKELGYVDVMIANAGIVEPKGLLNLSNDEFDRILRVNLRAVHLCYKHAAKQMIKQGTGGKLLVACSVASFRATGGLASYTASKFAVRGYNQVAALELAKYGITANGYAPGFTTTPLTSETQGDDLAAGAKAQALMASMIQTLPIKRAATTDDIANLVSFLVSRGSDYITEQTLSASGGLYML